MDAGRLQCREELNEGSIVPLKKCREEVARTRTELRQRRSSCCKSWLRELNSSVKSSLGEWVAEKRCGSRKKELRQNNLSEKMQRRGEGTQRRGGLLQSCNLSVACTACQLFIPLACRFATQVERGKGKLWEGEDLKVFSYTHCRAKLMLFVCAWGGHFRN